MHPEPQRRQDYDPAALLSDDQIRERVRIGTTAPTSFHLQKLALHRRYERLKPKLGCVDRLESARQSPKQP